MRRSDLAVPLSVVALAVSLVAVMLAAVAIFRDPVPTAAPAPSPGGSSTSGVVTPTTQPEPARETVAPDGEPPSEEGIETENADPLRTVEPSATYELLYNAQKLKVPAGCTTWLIDLDEPRVARESETSDFTYFACDEDRRLLFTDPRVAEVRSPESSAEDCVEAIRTSPSNSQITPSRDLTLCLVTDGKGAVGAPERSRIARVTIDAVNSDQSLNVTATTWEVPR